MALIARCKFVVGKNRSASSEPLEFSGRSRTPQVHNPHQDSRERTGNLERKPHERILHSNREDQEPISCINCPPTRPFVAASHRIKRGTRQPRRRGLSDGLLGKERRDDSGTRTQGTEERRKLPSLTAMADFFSSYLSNRLDFASKQGRLLCALLRALY